MTAVGVDSSTRKRQSAESGMGRKLFGVQSPLSPVRSYSGTIADSYRSSFRTIRDPGAGSAGGEPHAIDQRGTRAQQAFAGRLQKCSTASFTAKLVSQVPEARRCWRRSIISMSRSATTTRWKSTQCEGGPSVRLRCRAKSYVRLYSCGDRIGTYEAKLTSPSPQRFLQSIARTVLRSVRPGARASLAKRR